MTAKEVTQFGDPLSTLGTSLKLLLKVFAFIFNIKPFGFSLLGMGE